MRESLAPRRNGASLCHRIDVAEIETEASSASLRGAPESPQKALVDAEQAPAQQSSAERGQGEAAPASREAAFANCGAAPAARKAGRKWPELMNAPEDN